MPKRPRALRRSGLLEQGKGEAMSGKQLCKTKGVEHYEDWGQTQSRSRGERMASGKIAE